MAAVAEAAVLADRATPRLYVELGEIGEIDRLAEYELLAQRGGWFRSGSGLPLTDPVRHPTD